MVIWLLCAVCLVMFDSLQLHGLWPTRLLRLWNFPGKNTGAGCHFLLQGIFLTQGSNRHPLHWQVDSLLLHHLGSPSWLLSLPIQLWNSLVNCISVPIFLSFFAYLSPGPNHNSSVQFSRSVMSDSLRPHESQHARPPCPSPTPGVHSDSRPSSQWYHPAISSSVVPSPPAPNPSQHQSLFQWVNSSHEVAKVLEFQL